MPALPRPTAIVFDMDGTLLDSERIALATFTTVCAQFDVAAHPDVYRRCIGTRGSETQRILGELYGPSFPLEQFFAAWSREYQRHAIDAPVPIKDGVLDLLAHCSALDIPMAVATSTRRVTALTKLEHTDLLRHFRFLVCGDEVTEGKPHPEIFLTAAQRLGVQPTSAWAIEDSDIGVRSAVASGMTVFQIPDLHQPDDDVRSLGHRIVASMNDVLSALVGIARS